MRMLWYVWYENDTESVFPLCENLEQVFGLEQSKHGSSVSCNTRPVQLASSESQSEIKEESMGAAF